ncbi:MAG: aspartate kinase [bacterium]|nr:aspartate kinase [bacterium]
MHINIILKMKVLKFGGGVLKSAEEVEQMADIIKSYDEKIVIVISAFGKMTNAFESLLKTGVNGNSNSDYKLELNKIEEFHRDIVGKLFLDEPEFIISKIDELYSEIDKKFSEGLTENYDFEYDQVVPYGELISSVIVSEYFKQEGIENHFFDIREGIKTDSVFREAKINWKDTEELLKNNCFTLNERVCITQGFISSDKEGFTTTLGREGSDFTASVIAYCLNAETVEFWKEVRGIYNADPTKTEDFKLLPRLSYQEAVEQAYYGAKILHQKTIKPLQNKKIPISVRSFHEPNFQGTSIVDISEFSKDFYPEHPIYIVKENQILISISPEDFSFIAEDNLGYIFSQLAKYRIKVNLMQTAAISFSLCVNNNKHKVPGFISELKNEYKVRYNDNLTLITVRHYNDSAINKMISGKNVLLRQKSRHTARFVVR